MKKAYSIGCSGYYYSYWKNRFYPKGIQPKNWLEYYSSVFNTVELNGTFYRTPKLSDLKKYVSVTGEDFRFSVKMSRYITHIQKLNGNKDMVNEFQDLILNGLENKLACFLFQLPPSFHFTDENLERILENVPHKKENVVELRHISWWNDTVKKEFKKAKITFCNVDFPGLNSSIIQTTPLFYFRFHGNPELFKSLYSEEKLKEFYFEFPEKTKEHFIYFNNTYYEASYTNALQLKEIIQHA
jgi:uncharacterized protein YecE (DUF72 family)